METEAAKEVVKVIPAPVQEAPEQAEEEEEELDDLAFLRSALSVPSKDG